MSIRIRSLTKKFGTQIIFDGFNLDIPLHQTAVLSGASGVGKTTLLRIIAGLDRNYTGEILGVPDKISFMFQENRLLPWMNVKDNIAFVLRDVMDKDAANHAAADMIKAVRLEGHEDKFPENLSGGMKRRVALARTFCYPADLLLLDEPFKEFDAKLNNEMVALLDRLFVRTKKTVILVTHDLSVVEKIDCVQIDIDDAMKPA